MRILVIGAMGQIARALVEAAGARGLALVARGRPALDLTDTDSMRRALEKVCPDIVINAAAYTDVDGAENDPAAAYAVNRDGPGKLAALCDARAIALVHISTDYVFDGGKSTPYVESDPAAPLGVYGRSKHEGELAVMAATARHIIVRTAWVYSPFERNFVITMLRAAQSRNTLNVVSDQHGCPTYAPHIAQGLLDIAEQLAGEETPDDVWGIYNMTAGGATTWYDFAREIFACSAVLGGPVATVRPIASAQFQTAAQRPANSRLDCARLKAAFGIALPDWETGLAACLTRLNGGPAGERR